jgi:hypothetical protein
MTEKPIRQLADSSVRTTRIQPTLAMFDLNVQATLFNTFIAIEKADV